MASGHTEHRTPARGNPNRNAGDTNYDRSGSDAFEPETHQSDKERPSTGDREELIRRIKRGERPRWTPSEQLLRLLSENANEDRHLGCTPGLSSKEEAHALKLDNPANQVHEQGPNQNLAEQPSEQLLHGLEIRRPRSALHAGDFSTDDNFGETRTKEITGQKAFFSTSPPRPRPRPARPIEPTQSQHAYTHRAAFSRLVPPSQSRPTRPRGASLQSSSPGYILKPPTSPLVRETSNDDLDVDEFMSIDSPGRWNRRQTSTPIGSVPSTANYSSLTQAARLPASLRKDNTFPNHGHQHRRSLNASFSYQVATSPQTPPFTRSRAPSFSSDSSPRQTSMVGSYEESILRGRMSGTPSQPLEFTAEIGAVAVAPHKPSCPAHVHVDFPAVYYSWPTGLGRVGSSGQEPSPYVGRIDLETNLAPPKSKEERRRYRRLWDQDGEDAMDHLHTEKQREGQKKRKRRDPSPQEDSLGGCYRIPQKGSIQIIIRTPTKNAAKVFIVPYDLEGMEPCSRTWLRQRCYSAGPIIERALSSKQHGADGKGTGSDPKTKPTLRYLIHLKICSPSRGRFYLYDEIRVVFANRVPDNKESLKHEVQMPEPKFTAFKPQPRRNVCSPASSLTFDALDMNEDASLRRRSYGAHGSSIMLRSLPASESVPQSSLAVTPSTPVPAVPSNFGTRGRSFTVGTTSQEANDADTASFESPYLQSPGSDHWSRAATNGQLNGRETPTKGSSNGKSFRELLTSALDGVKDGEDTRFAKLRHEDKRYGGVFGRPATPEPGEGLIARRLRSLEVDEHDDKDEM